MQCESGSRRRTGILLPGHAASRKGDLQAGAAQVKHAQCAGSPDPGRPPFECGGSGGLQPACSQGRAWARRGDMLAQR